MKRHRWELIRTPWGKYYECLDCGLVKEKHYGMPWIYYWSLEGKEMIKAPPCPADESEYIELYHPTGDK